MSDAVTLLCLVCLPLALLSCAALAVAFWRLARGGMFEVTVVIHGLDEVEEAEPADDDDTKDADWWKRGEAPPGEEDEHDGEA